MNVCVWSKQHKQRRWLAGCCRDLAGGGERDQGREAALLNGSGDGLICVGGV